MAYLVTKTVKGRDYLYSQESYRDGDKVKTRSNYIGPADIDRKTGELSLQTPSSKDAVTVDRRIANSGISLRALDADHGYFSKLLGYAIGGDVRLAQASLKHARRKPGCKQTGNALLVNYPVSPDLKRSELRAYWRQSLSRAMLNELSLHSPSTFEALQSGFDAEFAKTRSAILLYLKHSSQRNAPYWAIAWKVFGVAHAIAHANGHMPSDKLGLVDYGRYKSWTDEATALLAELRRSGFNKTKARYEGHLVSADYALKEAIEHKSIWRKKRRAKIKRILARQAALRSTLQKIDLLYRVFAPP